jgi:hypothetical protein
MQLFHHQREGADWLADKPFAMLLDDQGLGKTITAITVADETFSDRLLVICPSVVLYNWRHEIQQWSPHRRVQVLQTGRDKLLAGADAVIVSHGLLLAPYIRAQLLALTWDCTVLDEAHFFRTPSAKRVQAFYGKWREPSETIVGRSHRVIAMTGTPMPNDPSEIWTHLHGLRPDLIHGANGLPISHNAFVKRYCTTRPTPWGRKITGGRNAAELRERIQGFGLRRMKKNVLDLPPVRFELVTIRADRNPLELESIEKTFSPAVLAEIKDGVNTTEGGFAAMKGSTEFSRWRRLCGLAKVDPAMDLLLMEMEHGGMDKVVVFAHHNATEVAHTSSDRVPERSCGQGGPLPDRRGRHRGHPDRCERRGLRRGELRPWRERPGCRSGLPDRPDPSGPRPLPRPGRDRLLLPVP